MATPMPPTPQAGAGSASAASRRDLPTLLLGRGVITGDQLRIAQQEQQRSGEALGRVLVRLGFITDEILTDAQSERWGIDKADLANWLPDPATLKLIPRDLAQRYSLVPLGPDDRGRFQVAMAHPDNVVARDQLRALLRNQYELAVSVASESDIAAALQRAYGYELSIDGILREIETGEVDYASLQRDQAEYSQPVVRLVDAILADAVHQGASDIHLEPEETYLRIRYRVDGVLLQVRSVHISYWAAMLVRLKVMAGMNIAESRAPQDGRLSLNTNGRRVDIRASVQPLIWGENFVGRILDRQRAVIGLESMHLSEQAYGALELMLSRPEGIILITGPTGSGKSTTLYGIMNRINSESINIMTLEDPVEFPLVMVRQAQVNESVKLDFASGIRSMMRQDPDVILIGEIRDEDTATMAFRAAMTGHQVFSTLHTNSAVGTLPRLKDLGVSPELVADNVIGIVAQRLVRRLCMACREPYTPEPIERQLLGLVVDPQPERVLYRAVGCPQCGGRGYKGRMAVMEVLRFDEVISELVAADATSHEVRRTALQRGFRELADEAIARVLSGDTSLAEVSRIINLTGRVA